MQSVSIVILFVIYLKSVAPSEPPALPIGSIRPTTLGPDDIIRVPSYDLNAAFDIHKCATEAGPESIGVDVSSFTRRKTGTTIVGVLCPRAGAVVLAADTRATDGEIVADKCCEKIHRLAPNVQMLPSQKHPRL